MQLPQFFHEEKTLSWFGHIIHIPSDLQIAGVGAIRTLAIKQTTERLAFGNNISTQFKDPYIFNILKQLKLYLLSEQCYW